MKPSVLSLASISLLVSALSACSPGGSSGKANALAGGTGNRAGGTSTPGSSLSLANGLPSSSGTGSFTGGNASASGGMGQPANTSPQQNSTTIATLALGITPEQASDLDLNAPPSPLPLPPLPPPPNSVPEPTTAVLVLSGIVFAVVSHLRKRQEVFDYYSK